MGGTAFDATATLLLVWKGLRLPDMSCWAGIVTLRPVTLGGEAVAPDVDGSGEGA